MLENQCPPNICIVHAKYNGNMFTLCFCRFWIEWEKDPKTYNVKFLFLLTIRHLDQYMYLRKVPQYNHVPHHYAELLHKFLKSNLFYYREKSTPYLMPCPYIHFKFYHLFKHPGTKLCESSNNICLQERDS